MYISHVAIIITDDVLYWTVHYHNRMIENRVSAYMGIKRMERRDIVKMTGINRHTLYNIYKNKTKGIDFETLNKLCYALECTPNDLFRYIPDEN